MAIAIMRPRTPREIVEYRLAETYWSQTGERVTALTINDRTMTYTIEGKAPRTLSEAESDALLSAATKRWRQ